MGGAKTAVFVNRIGLIGLDAVTSVLWWNEISADSIIRKSTPSIPDAVMGRLDEITWNLMDLSKNVISVEPTVFIWSLVIPVIVIAS